MLATDAPSLGVIQFFESIKKGLLSDIVRTAKNRLLDTLGVVYGTVRTRASYAVDGPITVRIDDAFNLASMLTNVDLSKLINR